MSLGISKPLGVFSLLAVRVRAGALYALQAYSCATQPNLLYYWAGCRLTSLQILCARLCIDLIARTQGQCVDYEAHLGGAAVGGLWWYWEKQTASAQQWGWHAVFTQHNNLY